MNWLAWALLSAFFAGLTAFLAKLGVAEINSHLATAIRTTIILLLTWAIAVWTMHRGDLAAISRRTWLFLALSAVATGLSWLCYFRALQLGEVSKVAPIDKLSVVIAIALAALFLDERLQLRETLGVASIVLGAVLLAWK